MVSSLKRNIMRTRIYLFVTLFTATTLAIAQEKPKAEFGAHVGPSISLFYNQHPLENPRKPGKPLYNAWAFGISGQYNFNPMVALRAEANFERKGEILFNSRTFATADNGQSFFTNSSGYNSLGYFTLPVTVKLSFGKRVKFFTNLGLYAGFIMTAQEVTRDATFNRAEPGKVTTLLTETDITNDTKRVDGGLVTGLGVFVPLYKTLSLTFEGRNNLGFVNMNNGSDNFPSNWYNNSTSFLVGFSVGLNKPEKVEKQTEEENNSY
jgi:hypothetical protein